MRTEDYTKRCQECIKRSQVAKEPLQPHDIPEGPWRKIDIDYFTFDGNSYVLICDYFSKFPFLYRAKTSFWSLRDRLIDFFSIEGYPDEIVSDNGPPFQSKEFAKFLSGLGIKHTTSSPGYPRSNGFTERHIQTVKNMLSKSSNTRSFQEVRFENNSYWDGTAITCWDASRKKPDNKGASWDRHQSHPFCVAGETVEDDAGSWHE